MDIHPQNIPENSTAAVDRVYNGKLCRFFEFHGIQIDPILLTQDGMMEDPRRGPVKDTIAALWHHHVIDNK